MNKIWAARNSVSLASNFQNKPSQPLPAIVYAKGAQAKTATKQKKTLCKRSLWQAVGSKAIKCPTSRETSEVERAKCRGELGGVLKCQLSSEWCRCREQEWEVWSSRHLVRTVRSGEHISFVIQTWTLRPHPFFCCALLACHEGRGRSPSVSEIGEKPDFPNFSNELQKHSSNEATM